MGRVKQGKPRRVRPPQTEELPPLANSPARTLFMLAEKGLDDEESRAMVVNWPYTLRINTATRTSSLAEAAKLAKVSINETAEGMVMMEQEGFMTWDSAKNELTMVVPPGAQPSS